MKSSRIEEVTMATHEIRSKTQLALGPDDAGRAVSAEEFADALYEEPWRYERVRGRLVVMTPDGGDHVETASPWLRKLYAFWDNHPEVVDLVVGNAWIRVDDWTDRIGDIGVYMAGALAAPKIPDRIPDLMFEIVSPGRTSRNRDYVSKRSEYERLGVKEYVIVDRFKKQVTVHTLAAGAYQAQILTAADTYTSPRLPGLAIPLAEVWKS
jgi:Uma2 family endonuclease